MEVLAYQIGIALIIIVVGGFSTKARITIAIVAGIFTLVMVFTTWLAILQFVTIFVAYAISDGLADKQSINSSNEDSGGYSCSSCLTVIVIGVIILWISSLFSDDKKSKKSIKQELNKDSTIVQPAEPNSQQYQTYDGYKPYKPEAVAVPEEDVENTQPAYDEYNQNDEQGDPLNGNLE